MILFSFAIGQSTNVESNVVKNTEKISQELNLRQDQSLELMQGIQKLGNKDYYENSDGKSTYKLKTEIVNNDSSFRQIILETKDKKNIKVLFNKDIQATNDNSK